MYKIGLLYLIVLASLIYAYLQWYSLKDGYLGWDEVHYIQATKQGFFANYLDKSSTNIVDFICLGFAKATKNEQQVQELQQNLPDEKSDLFRLRHFHPPIPAYIWTLFVANPRVSSLFIFGGFLVLFLYNFFVFNPQNWKFGFYFIPIFCTSKYFLDSFFFLNFHSYFTLAVLFFWAKLYLFLQKNTYKNHILLALSIALLALNLETYIIILAFLPVGLYFTNFRNIPKVGRLLGTALIFIFLLNPSFFWTGGSLKSWAMYAFRIFLAGNEEYQSVAFFQQWAEIFSHNYFLFSVLFLALIFSFLLRKTLPKIYFLLLFLAFIYAIFMTPFMLYQTYQLPAIALFTLFATLVITHFFAHHKANFTSFTTLNVLLSGLLSYYFYNNSFREMQKQVAQRNIFFDEIIKEIHNTQDKMVLADGEHIFEFYSLQNNFQHLRTVQESKPLFFKRENYQNMDCTEAIKTQQYGLIIFLKSRHYSKEDFAFLEKNHYTKNSIGDYYVFKLRKP